MTIRVAGSILEALLKPKKNGGALFRGVGRAVLNAVFPPKCTACGAFYPFPDAGYGRGDRLDPNALEISPPRAFLSVMAPYFCPACRDDFPAAKRPVCSQCGGTFEPKDAQAGVCDACRSRKMHFHSVHAFGIYDGGLKTALHLLKYRSKTQLAQPLGALLFTTFLRHWPERDIDIVVPVPLHPRKFRRRGFNQAYLLVRKWPDLAAAGGISFPKEMVQRSALRRIRETDTQVGMSRGTRRKNIRHAVTPGRAAVSGKKILLVDDVYTTGATADECARALREAGAVRVDVLALAQTVRNL